VAKKRLTELAVERLKPTPGKQVDYFDSGMPGLVLRVNFGGSKVWRALYYVGGKTHSHSLGKYPVLRVKEARERARLFLQDPQGALNKRKDATFAEVAAEFMARYVRAKGLRTGDEIERYLNRIVIPEWGDRPFNEINRDDVSQLLDRISDRHTVRQADKALAILRKLMGWRQANRSNYATPIVAGMRRAPAASRDRILDDDELRDVWTAAADFGCFGDVVGILLLSAQRLTKVAEMRWQDLNEGVWTVPTEPREKGNIGRVKLPRSALDIITRRPRIVGNPFVFASGRGSNRFDDFGTQKRRFDQKLLELRRARDPEAPPMPNWRLHDLRRTARSLLSRAQVQPHIAERVLGHTLSGLIAVYDRHTYAAEKDAALEALASLIARIVDPQANVIPFARPSA
jgi:hypothetical protein